jgi:hypothetical protein
MAGALSLHPKINLYYEKRRDTDLQKQFANEYANVYVHVYAGGFCAGIFFYFILGHNKII